MSRLIASIIIPTCNRKELLKKCLEALTPEKQEINSFEYEIIVSDDSQNNETELYITQHFPYVHYVKGPQKGRSSNRNNGAKKAIGEWLIFIDDDCIPNNILLRTYFESFKNPKIDVYEGCVISDRKRNKYREEAPINTTGNKFWSCNIAIRKKKFDYINGFDVSFEKYGMEDVDLFLRLKENAISIKFLRNAYVIHPYRPSPNIKGILARQQSILILLKKHPYLYKKYNLHWLFANVKQNINLHLKYFLLKDSFFLFIKIILIFYLFFKIKNQKYSIKKY